METEHKEQKYQDEMFQKTNYFQNCLLTITVRFLTVLQVLKRLM